MKHETFLSDMQAAKDAAKTRQGFDERFGCCKKCGTQFDRINNGRPRLYCSDPCREVDRRPRHRGKHKPQKMVVVPF